MEDIQKYLSFGSAILNILLIPLITIVWRMSQEYSDQKHKIQQLEEFKMQTTKDIKELDLELSSTLTLIRDLKEDTMRGLQGLKDDFRDKLGKIEVAIVRFGSRLKREED